MKSLLEKLQKNLEDYSDKGKAKFFSRLIVKYSQATYYELMGVSEEMNQEDKEKLNKNYKQLALILHPDKASGRVYKDVIENLFKLVTDAHSTLKDPLSEQKYKSKLSINKNIKKQEVKKPNENEFKSVFVPNKTSFNHMTTKFTTFSTGSFDKTYDRDIKAGEKISLASENVLINGNVYGQVTNMSGDITVNGNVVGILKNMSGNNIVKGDVKESGLC